MNLHPAWRKALLAVHLITAVGALGADLVLLTLGISAVTGGAPEAIYPAAQLVGTNVLRPLVVGALGTGVLLATLTHWGLVTYWWVAIKLVITAALTGVVLFVLLPALRATAVAAAAGAPLDQAQRLPLLLAPAAASSLLAVAVVLGVFKPGGRLRSRTRQAVEA